MSRPQSTPTQKPTYVVVRLPRHAIASPSKYDCKLRLSAPTYLSCAVAATLWPNEFRLAAGHRTQIVELHSATRKAVRIVPALSADARKGKSVRLRSRTFQLSQHDCPCSHEETPFSFPRAFDEAVQTADSSPVRLTAIYPLLH